MDEVSPTSRPFTVRVLPWILGALFFVLYALTVHPWLSPSNVWLMGQLLGWEPDQAYTEPLLYLLSAPLRLLSPEKLPQGMNLLAAVLGGVNIAILARCIALLPHDRTREQRIRGHGENTLLHGWFAALPVVFGSALLGLQLTFWENATLQTGEMVDLLLFSFCVLALLEYRQDLREGWLATAAFVWGMGIANSWAMIGFAPLFVVGVAWIRGWSFFNAAFLTRMILCGLAGMLVYFVVPLISLLMSGPNLGFWGTLKANLILQKTYLLGIPRGRPLLLALVSVLPLGLVGIRWEGVKGSTVERYASFGAVILLQVLWLTVAIYTAFDPRFSPRQMMYLDESGGGLPLLTFGFTGALSAAYFAGWFILVGFAPAEKSWDQPNPIFLALSKLAAVLALVASVATPAALLARNWGVIRAQNSEDSRNLAKALVAPLPAQPALVIADNPVVGRLARAANRTLSGQPQHVFLETLQAPDPRYRDWLVYRSTNVFPQLAVLGSAKENVAGLATQIVSDLARVGRAFYLHPSFGFFFEQVQAIPNGVIQQLVPQPPNLNPQVAAPEQLAAATRAWQSQADALRSVVLSRKLATKDGPILAAIWSRAGNTLGVQLQRGRKLEDAGHVFEQALELNPENRAAEVNRNVNQFLVAKKPLTDELARPLANEDLQRVMNQGGPVDEPTVLAAYGGGLLKSADRLPRQAWDAFDRADQLSPGQFSLQLAKIEALLQAGELKTARAALNSLASARSSSSLSKDELAGLQRLEIYYALTQGDVAGAEKRIEMARAQFGTDLTLLDLLTRLYIQQKRYDEAIGLLEQWRKLKQDDLTPLLRIAAIQMARNQYEPALKLADQVLVVQPDNPAARLNRAVCLLRLDRLDDSKREYLALKETLPDLPMLHFGLGEIALRKGDTNEALAAFDKYLKSAPTNTTEYAEIVVRVNQLRRR